MALRKCIAGDGPTLIEEIWTVPLGSLVTTELFGRLIRWKNIWNKKGAGQILKLYIYISFL